jgi:hypothetical protein
VNYATSICRRNTRRHGSSSSVLSLVRRRASSTTPRATAIAALRRRSGVDGEDVARLQDVGVAAGPEDLLVLASPFRVVDGVDPIFHLHHETAVFGDRAREVGVVVETLRLLERQRAVLAVAGVHLERVLVGVDLDLDAGPGGLKTCYEVALVAPVVGLLTIDEPAIVCFYV